MASTNKTTNYELSQYVGTDKPTYLGDYNGDMLKIDTAIHGVAESVGSETSRINIIENNIGSLSSLSTTDKTSVVNAINEVDTNSKSNATNIGTLSNLTTSNKTSIVNAVNEVDADIKKFNLTNITSYAYTQLTAGPNTNIAGGTITIATNSDKSIAKIYGFLTGNATNSSRFIATIPDSGITPDTMISIAPTGIAANQQALGVGQSSIEINTDGSVVLKGTIANGTQGIFFMPCLYFIKDFGDVPQS